MMSCGKPHETDCVEVLAKIYAYLDGELTSSDVERINRHLDECGPCLNEQQMDQLMKALVQRGCRRVPAPETLRQRIMVSITEVRIRLES